MAEQIMNGEQYLELQQRLSRFLAETCDGLCLDNDQERDEVADKLAHLFMSGGSVDMTPNVSMPKARYRLQFDIYDEATGDMIISLALRRTPEMTDGDFLQLQNFFWREVGKTIKNSPDVIRTLMNAGIDVKVDPGQG